MEKRELKSNYILAIVNLFLFVTLFCFVFEYAVLFIRQLKSSHGFHASYAWAGVIFPLIFYVFVADTNSLYEASQHFFFRSTILNLIFPSLLILLALGYALIPRILRISFAKDLYTFLGTAAFSVHLIFVANNSKDTSFTGFINYIFVLTMITLVCLIILSLYFEIAFSMHIGNLIITSIKEGAQLLKSIFIRVGP